MRLNVQLPIFPDKWDETAFKSVLKWQHRFLQDLRRKINYGRLGFGDGTATDNIHGTWITYTTNAVVNTEDAITHNLGEVPIGWLEFSRDKASRLYKGTTTWTKTQLFLKCDTASVAMLIFVLGKSNEGDPSS